MPRTSRNTVVEILKMLGMRCNVGNNNNNNLFKCMT